MDRQKIVIAGAGFGGVRAALQLSKQKHIDVTVIADHDTFRYYPALYATATGHSQEESIIPLANMFEKHSNITFIQDRLVTLEAGKKRIKGESGTWYTYDSLILALGMVTNYFGISGLKEYSYGIKSQEEVEELKDHLHNALTTDHHLDTNYIVVGAGPTGVELAASMREYIGHIADCHGISEHNVSLRIVEAVDRVLPRMSKRASSKVARRLEDLGVNVMLSSKVEGETVDELTVNGEKIPTHTVVWTSGMANNPFFDKNSAAFTLAPNHKVQVDDFLQGTPSVYVIGDNAATAYSGLAQTALYDADFVARNITRPAKKLRPRVYKPRKPPVVVPVGRHWAIVEWGPFVFGGLAGALVRRAADFIGYNDVLPLRKALNVWRSASKLEEACPVCKKDLVADSNTL